MQSASDSHLLFKRGKLHPRVFIYQVHKLMAVSQMPKAKQTRWGKQSQMWGTMLLILKRTKMSRIRILKTKPINQNRFSIGRSQWHQMLGLILGTHHLKNLHWDKSLHLRLNQWWKVIPLKLGHLKKARQLKRLLEQKKPKMLIRRMYKIKMKKKKSKLLNDKLKYQKYWAFC